MLKLMRYLLAGLVIATLACGRTELGDLSDVPDGDAPDGDVSDGDVPDGDAADTDAPEVACTSNRACDDGLFCDGVEECVAGRCVRGVPVNCDDGVSCTLDRCDEGTRACVREPVDRLCASGRCDPVTGCTGGGCASDRQCDDGDPCNGSERCAGGACARSSPPSCDDGVGCTVDFCMAPLGCVHRPDDARCDDRSFCNGAERCDPGAGGCARGVPVLCDDGDRCTLDRCDEATRSCVRLRLDADSDGFASIACGGPDCDDGNPLVNPRVAEQCANRVDDNCDGRTDCADPVCALTATCRGCFATGPEDNPTACRDGRDNDCDGVTDCRDTECAAVLPCAGCVPTGPEAPRGCADGVDNDCNGARDCLDPACAPLGVCCRPSPELCGDGSDNDCDGLVDCADSDCAFTPPCGGCRPTGPENNPAACADGRDNDCDGAVDCADPECRFTPGCVTCMPTGPEACTDGRDNDCNGSTDCADPACARTPACGAGHETCEAALPLSLPGRASGTTAGARNDYTPTCASSNAPDLVYVVRNPARQTLVIHTNGSSYDTMLLVFRETCGGAPVACDDDGGDGVNSLVILRDAPAGTYYIVVDGWATGSGAFQLSVGTAPLEVCDNRVDDDGDGAADCADPDCATFPPCMMCLPTGPENNPTACADGRDNDCNGRTDCADPGCSALPSCCRPTGPEGSLEACTDGRDNDCDGALDCLDADCAALPSCCRAAPEVCTDGRDNDCDGRADCADTDCAALPVCGGCVPTGPEGDPTSCRDGRDNDCDGALDCRDPGCFSSPSCVRPPPNDTCATATALMVPGVFTGSTLGATNNGGPVTAGFPGCAGGSGPDVVYQFTLDRTVPVTIDTVGSAFDTVLYVRRPPCETGAQVACNDDEGGLSSRVSFLGMPGTYYVFVDGFGATSTGAFTLRVAFGAPAESCSNGRDDDLDGLIDCGDPDCARAPGCGPCVPAGPENAPFVCADGRDNDCDGFTDCADPECGSAPSCCRPTGLEEGPLACRDGRDNDCDGLADCADPGCGPVCVVCVPTAPRELGLGPCTNGRDDDCDGMPDCADPDCRGVATLSECCNGRDDNGNGIIDELACACTNPLQCVGVGGGGPLASNVCWSTRFGACGPNCNALGGDLLCTRFFPGTTCDARTGECR
ncbi:MAG: PPC domain-containing protein [Deltaproteobacteria bacterium]|nr:PPC domain-containing protein [Deltaproteobacteria bacterium]